MQKTECAYRALYGTRKAYWHHVKHVSREPDSASDAVSCYRIICANVYITRPSSLSWCPRGNSPRCAHAFFTDDERTVYRRRYDQMGIASITDCDAVGAVIGCSDSGTVPCLIYAQSSKWLCKFEEINKTTYIVHATSNIHDLCDYSKGHCSSQSRSDHK